MAKHGRMERVCLAAIGGVLAATFAFDVCVAQPGGPPQSPAPAAQTGVVFIGKDDLAKALAARAAGQQLATLAAVRAGDDRISVDVLKRVDAAAEGPVTHDVVTEVYYILEGGGMMETGGAIPNTEPMLTNGRPTNPANIGPSRRGVTIEGGSLRHVAAGDIVIIPPNTPHRFKSLDGSVTYLAVRLNPGYERSR
jgi:mannose-6-phosphate isomerase-like protein (cupin superfamily)